MSNCVGCSTAICSGSRRRLATPSSQHINTVLLEVMNSIVPADKQLDIGILLNSFICLPCFRWMEKIVKLRRDSQQAFHTACIKARHALPYFPGSAPPHPRLGQSPPPSVGVSSAGASQSSVQSGGSSAGVSLQPVQSSVQSSVSPGQCGQVCNLLLVCLFSQCGQVCNLLLVCLFHQCGQVKRVGKTIGVLGDLLKNFDKQRCS